MRQRDDEPGPDAPVTDAPAAVPDPVPGSRPAVVLAIVLVTAVLVTGQLVALRGAADGSAPLWLDVAVGLLGLALLPVLLRRPVPTAIVLLGLVALTPVATPPATGAVYHVAQSRRLRTSAAVAAAGVLAHLVQGWWRPRGDLPFGWWLLLVVVAHATLLGWGRYAQARRDVLRALRERARRLEAEQVRRVAAARAAERARIAREMHDVLAHRLTLVATHAGALEYRPDQSPDRLAHAAGVVREGAHQALEELREVIGLLREDLDDDGTASPQRPQPTLAELDRLVEENRRAGARVELSLEVDPVTVPAPLARTVYRVVQESLTNARRHAPGVPVRVVVAGDPGVELELAVSNRLAGGEPAVTTAAGGSGTGLVGVRERLELAGGTLHTDVVDGEFRLRARLPYVHGGTGGQRGGDG